MTSRLRLIALAIAAMSLAACGSNDKPAQTPADSTAATADTQAAASTMTTTTTTTTDTAAHAPVAADTAAKPGAPSTTTTATVAKTPVTSTTTTTTTATQPPAKPATPSQPVAENKPTPPPPAPAPAKTPEPPAPTPPPTPPAVTASGPKAIFLEEKCSACHAIKSQGIPAQGDRDLSNVGSKRSMTWIVGWLEKKEEIDGKKHKKTFKGSEENLKTLAQWLAGLK